jgi:hypothetical protein
MKHPVTEQKQKFVFYIYLGKKHWQIYYVIGRDDPESGNIDLFYVDEINPIVGSNNSRLRNEHPFIIGVGDTFKTMEKAKRELMRRVWK